MPELRFSRSLYEPEALHQTVAAFSPLAGSVTLTEHEHELVVEVVDPHPHYGDGLVDELANYALQKTIALRRGSS